MATRPADAPSGSPAGLQAATLCEAFQRTAAIDPDAVALRTPGGAVSITWREYAERVRTIAAGPGRPRRGPGRHGGADADQPPRVPPGRHGRDAPGGDAVLDLQHLARPSRSPTCSPTPPTGSWSASRSSWTASGPPAPRSSTSCASTARPTGTLSLEQLEASGDPDFDFDAAWRAVEPDDVLTLIYTSGTTGPPKGVRADPRQHAGRVPRAIDVGPARCAGDRIISYLPSAHIADRVVGPLLADGLRHAGHLRGRPEDDRPGAGRRPADDLGRRAPGVGEDQGGDRGAIQASRRAAPQAPSGPSRPACARCGRAGRRDRATGAGPSPQGRRAGAVEVAPSSAWTALGGLGAAAIAPETLEFFMALGLPDLRALGHVGDLVPSRTSTRPAGSRSARWAWPCPASSCGWPRTASCSCRGPLRHAGLPQRAGEDRRGDRRRRLAAHRRRRRPSTPTATSRIVDRKKELIINAAGKNMSPANIENAAQVGLPAHRPGDAPSATPRPTTSP